MGFNLDNSGGINYSEMRKSVEISGFNLLFLFLGICALRWAGSEGGGGWA